MAFPVPPLLAQITPYVTAETSLFSQLVKTGETEASMPLPAQMHAFLIGCLSEHLSDTRVAHRFLALEHLKAVNACRTHRAVVFKLAGDEALLVYGLFPGLAKRRNVDLKYFRHMGQTAYASAAAQLMSIGLPEHGRFFDAVAEHFVPLAHVLEGAREQPEGCWNLKLMLEARQAAMLH